VTFLSLQDAATIYDCVSRSTLSSRGIQHPRFRRFCTALGVLQRQVQDEEDLFWSGVLQALRRVRFVWSAVPLPFNHPALLDPSLLRVLTGQLDQVIVAYPDLVRPFRDVLEILGALLESEENPLLAALLALQAEDEVASTGILMKATRFIPVVEAAISEEEELVGCDVLASSDLNTCTGYDRLVVIGPARWYPGSVLSSPRGRDLVVLRYSWIRDEMNVEPQFVGSTPSRRNLPQQRVGAIASTVESSDEVIDAVELLPVIDWRAVMASETHSASPTFDDVAARLFLLEDHQLVFLDGDDDSTALIIDLSSDRTERVRRIPIREVVPGLFLLLRTEGGSDFVVEVANHILGQRATSSRASQFAWKEGLRKYARVNGIAALSTALRVAGSSRASETNVRNWMSARSIRPEDRRDFAAIMAVIGRAESTDRYWAAMSEIDRAHLLAGQQIRQLLLRQVRAANLRVLEHEGHMDFTLPNAGGGRLTAFRVIDVAPDIVRIPIARIGHPGALESAQWHA